MDTLLYTIQVASFVSTLRVTATAQDASASIQVKGMQVASGSPSQAIPLVSMVTMIMVTVRGHSGDTMSYGLAVKRAPEGVHYLKASNTKMNQLLGYGLSLSGDTLAVGAFGESSNARGVNGDQMDSSASESGAVYVFRWNGSTWAQEAYIKASNIGPGDRFGEVLSLSGDTLAVSARFEDSSAIGVNGNQTDNSAAESGAVYVLRRTWTTWAQEAYIKASNTEALDGFGSSVALSGDLLAVGANGEDSSTSGVNGNQRDNSAASSGAVYIFPRTGTTWTQEAYLKASNVEKDDYFGSSVVLSGNTLAVGAHGEDSSAKGMNGDQNNNSALGSGAAYLFRRFETYWEQQAYLKASNADAYDEFGYRVSLSGDTVVVAAMSEDSGATGVDGDQTDNTTKSSGAVYSFH